MQPIRRALMVWAILLASCAHKEQQAASAPPPPPVAAAPGETVQRVSGTTLPDEAYQRAMQNAYQRFRGLREGKNADYIPVLAKVDPNLYGIAIVTVDGHVYEVGDSKHPFSIQSVSKVFTLARILEDLGDEAVAKKIGVYATGEKFNSINAIEENKDKQPAGNPFVNPGAIASVSLVRAANGGERWNRIMSTHEQFAGRRLTVDEQVYKSESETNTRNRAIAWLLKAYQVLEGDPNQVLDLYTRQCSIAVSAKDLAVMGATLANGGVNPISGKRLLSEKNAAHVLAVMMTAGLYDASGDWAYRVGVPAKSGVGGGIVAVVPGRYAIGTFSPPLDEPGNSVRGQRAIEAIVQSLGGNVFAGPARPLAERE